LGGLVRHLGPGECHPASLTAVYAAASEAASRKAWFPRGTFTVSSQTANQYLNGAWNGTARINIGFYSKGRNKAQIAIQVSKLSDESVVASERERWKVVLGELEKLLVRSDAPPRRA
jgi:outer membrane protein TolC